MAPNPPDVLFFPNSTLVAETIALYLRDVDSPRPYLYTQIFAGLAYVIASGFMLELRRVLHRKRDLEPP